MSTAAPAQEIKPVAEADPNLTWNRSFWARYQWPQNGDEWSLAFGGTEAMWTGMILPRIRPFVPCQHILEIAPGHGRCTQYLRRMCRRLTIVDIVPECIEACRRRFGDDKRMVFAVNDGRSLDMVRDSSIDFAFTWDSLVHVEHETIRAYLGELARKLRPGGYGFIHHSNLGVHPPEQIDALDPAKDLHGRRPSMTAAKFREDCKAVGLRCLTQEIVPWGSGALWLDAFSLFVRDEANAHLEPLVVERKDWVAEIENIRRNARLYRRVRIDPATQLPVAAAPQRHGVRLPVTPRAGRA